MNRSVDESCSDIEKSSAAFWDKLLSEEDQGRTRTNEEIVNFYDKWARDRCIDKAIEAKGYPALDVMQSTVEELFPADVRDHVTILDVGTCTGNSGQRLYQMGFPNIDGLEPSLGSLRLAEERGVYRKLYNLALTAEPLDILPDTYDMVVLLGVMGPGHISVDAFTEMIRLVKPGGYILNLTRADFLEKCQEYTRKWKPTIERHKSAGKWRQLKEQRYSDHFDNREGRLHLFQIC
ncbi:methyltransferase-like protein 27 [Babylonia areolata]|uniref:methyltransferase-like protein 27 n=1 Tax=Babylonia areolata TaxID=304850 RepID=UPI003FD4270B